MIAGCESKDQEEIDDCMHTQPIILEYTIRLPQIRFYFARVADAVEHPFRD